MNNTLGNAEPQPQSAISEDFLKSGIPIYNSEVLVTGGRETRRRKRRMQEIAKR